MSYVRQTRFNIGSKIFIYGVIAAVFMLSAATGVLIFRDNGTKNIESAASASSDINKINVIRGSRNIQAGEMADVSKFEVVAMPRDLVPPGAVESVQWLKNKRVSNAISEKEILLKNDLIESGDWYEEGDRLIEHTFSSEAIPLTVVVGSIVDIKLFRPGGIDNVVVAKAVVIGKVDKTLSFYLNDTEQEYIKEANVEGQLFLVQYLDKSQPEGVVTYLPTYNQGNKATEQGMSYSEKPNLSGGN